MGPSPVSPAAGLRQALVAAGPEAERRPGRPCDFTRSPWHIAGTVASRSRPAPPDANPDADWPASIQSSGFGSVQHFLRTFRRHDGCSPAEYRASERFRDGDSA